MPACAAACCCWRWWWGGCSWRNRAALDSSSSNVAAAQPRGSLVVAAAEGCRKVQPVGMHPETVVTLGWHEDFSRMSPDRGCSAMNRCTLGQPISPCSPSSTGEGFVFVFFFFSFSKNSLPSPGSQQRTLKRLLLFEFALLLED